MKIAFLYMGDVRHVPSTIFGPIGIAYIASHIEKYGGFSDLHLEVDVKKIIDLKWYKSKFKDEKDISKSRKCGFKKQKI